MSSGAGLLKKVKKSHEDNVYMYNGRPLQGPLSDDSNERMETHIAKTAYSCFPVDVFCLCVCVCVGGGAYVAHSGLSGRAEWPVSIYDHVKTALYQKRGFATAPRCIRATNCGSTSTPPPPYCIWTSHGGYGWRSIARQKPTTGVA